jgi:hypothetical protein
MAHGRNLHARGTQKRTAAFIPGRFTLETFPVAIEQQSHVSYSQSGDLRT